MSVVRRRVDVMVFARLVKTVPFMISLVSMRLQKSKRTLQRSMSSCRVEANGNRYVDGLQEKIGLLEKQLRSLRDDRSNLRLYDYDKDHITPTPFSTMSSSASPFADAA